MLPERNLKIIADALGRGGLKVLTNDITENMPRPCFHVQLTNSSIQLHNQGTEVEMRSSYKITYFASREYVSAVQMQMQLAEVLGRKIQGADYTIYPTELRYTVYPVDGILEAEFSTYNWHTISAGTEEATAELMQNLFTNEEYNKKG